MPRRPHVVLFNPDHYRGDVLSHQGNEGAVTPNLDRLVREEGAASFRNAFCQNPVCSPSRCSFMSGWYPHVHGHRTMNHLMHPGENVLLKTLKDAGYWVWWGGKNDLVAGQHGYHDYCNVRFSPSRTRAYRGEIPDSVWRGQPGSDTYYGFFKGRIPTEPGIPFYHDPDWAYVLGAIDLIREAPEGRPLCIYVPLVYPHLPFAVEDPWFGQIDRSKVPSRVPTPRNWEGLPSILRGLHENYGMASWSEERWRELKAVYYGMCARIDHQVGLVVEALKQKGIWDDTAFFFFSDHGEYAGDYGVVDINQNTFHDALTRVPFIIKLPAWVKGNAGIHNALVELIDLPATIEELTGLSLPEDHFGRSLLPLLRGERSDHRGAVFCEGGRLRGEFQAMELDVGSALRPEGLYYPRLKLQRSNGAEHTKAVMCRTPHFKFVKRLYEQDELYDLTADPYEQVNVVKRPEYREVLADLMNRTLTFFVETGDCVPRTLDKRE